MVKWDRWYEFGNRLCGKLNTQLGKFLTAKIDESAIHCDTSFIQITLRLKSRRLRDSFDDSPLKAKIIGLASEVYYVGSGFGYDTIKFNGCDSSYFPASIDVLLYPYRTWQWSGFPLRKTTAA